MSKKRVRQVLFKMTEPEYAHMLKKMESLNISNMSAYIRKMALDGYCLRLDLPEIRKMTTLLSRCGNNLNQYAKRANQTGSIYEEDIRDLKAQFDRIETGVQKILGELLVLR